MTLQEKIQSLNDEQKEIYNIIKLGYELSKHIQLKTIYLNSKKPKPSIRRIICELKELGLIVNGSKRGFYRVVVEEIA